MIDALPFETIAGITLSGPHVDAETHTRPGLPWFDLLAPTEKDIAAAERLASAGPVSELEGRTEVPLPIPEHLVRRRLGLRDAARRPPG